MKAFVLSLCAVVTAQVISAQDPAFSGDGYLRQKGIDVTRYQIEVEITPNSKEIAGHTDVTFNLQDSSASTLALDFADMFVDSVSGASQKLAFQYDKNRITISLGSPWLKKKHNTVSIYYHGTPQDGLYLGANKFGDWVAFSDNWPNRAHFWFPGIDHPSDKATVEFKITGPADYKVVANGKLIGETQLKNGRKTSHWIENEPIPTYCMVFGAAHFSVLQNSHATTVPLAFYVYPKDSKAGEADFQKAGQMLAYYSSLIAPYPYEKLALVQSTTRFGGMENSSAIFFDEKSITGEHLITGTVAHEIAHQWFGDSVTESDWYHLWLSEGFATYFATLFFEHIQGKAVLRNSMAAQRKRIVAFQVRVGPKAIVDTTVTDLFRLLNPNNYQKGSWVLHMLRGIMGDDKFFAGIRAYYHRFQEGNALTRDFQKVMEMSYGQSLDWFFNEWIFAGGYPEYLASWTWKAEKRTVEISISQNQTGQIFRMPLTVQLDYAHSSRRETIWVDAKTNTFSFASAEKPSQLIFDPDGWVLKRMELKTPDQ